MQVFLLQFACCVLTGLAFCKLKTKGSSWFVHKIFVSGCILGVITQFAIILTLAFGLGKFALYFPEHATNPIFLGKYALLALFVLAVELLAIHILSKRVHFSLEQKTVPISALFIAKKSIVVLLITLSAFLAALIWFVSSRLVLWLGHMGADQLVYTLTAGGGSSTADTEAEILLTMVLPTVLAAVVGCAICFFNKDIELTALKKTRKIPARRVRSIAYVLTSCALVASVVYAFNALPLAEVIRATVISSGYFEDNYVEPNSQIIRFPKHKRNVLHIYMESFENSYFDKANGGYGPDNLAPDLLELSKEGISFSNSDVMGGPFETVGATHSVAAMVNFWSGVPMKSITGSGGKFDFRYPNFLSLGDIFAAEGYNEEFMLGADVAWGNLGDYYLKHGDFKIFDHQYAIDNGYIPKDYRVWWGYEDDKLYAWAKDELTNLAKDDKPFYFVLENADTHRPDGYVSKNMTEKPFDKQYSNVIHYSQKEVVKFVRWAQEQSWYKNTTIIITGDHHSMDQNYFVGWDPAYKRTIFNLILNSAVEDPGSAITQNREYAPFDYFPTILVAAGVEIKGNRLGLGTNLFSGEKTLIERDGESYVNEQLSLLSSYYNNYGETEYH